MTLYEYLELTNGDEVTVLDKDYDVEVYFYFNDPNEKIDDWDKAMMDLSKVLTVTAINGDRVSVNMWDVIDAHIDALDNSDLFVSCDTESIMDDIESILAGNVSEKWLTNFVNVLMGE